MIYTEIKPHPYLKDYIDAFWTVEGVGQQLTKECILPDGCVDLIFNLGNDCKTENGEFILESGKSYLVGTMTSFQESYLDSTNKLVGIRFKPAAFASFFNYISLNEITNKSIEFERSISPDIHQIERSFVLYLNTFFLNKLNDTKHNLFNVVKDIQNANGQIGICALAQKNYTTERQLERNFKKYIGIAPKEFANIVRFKTAFSEIQNNSNKSFSDIAFNCGYYDHSHLTNEIKRYTGSAPSQF